MGNDIKAHSLVFLATVLIAISFVVSEKLAGVLHPVSLTLFRFIVAFFTLLPMVLCVKKYRKKIKRGFSKGLKIGFFYSLYFIFMFKSLEYTSSLNIATLITSTPLITAFCAIFILKESLSFKKIAIYLFGIVGTLIVIFNGSLEAFLHVDLNKGDIVFLFGVFSMAFYSISAKYFYDNDDEVVVLTLTTLLGGIIWMGLALFAFDIPLEWEKIENEYLYYMIYLSIGATLLTVYLYQEATVILGPSKVVAYIYLNPSLVALIMFFCEGSMVNFNVLFGIFISFFATIILLKK